MAKKSRAKDRLTPKATVPDISRELQELQRQRVFYLKSRLKIANRLTAGVAVSRGYNAGMEEKERGKRWAEAGAIIKSVLAGEQFDPAIHGLIVATSPAIDAFDRMVKGIDREMLKLVKQLPIQEWMDHPEQRGFGWLMLSQVIGETGDLNNYANPGKVWRRLGLAPFESRGLVRQGSTWKKFKPTLSADEWTDYGYNARRRSVAYLVGEALLKMNGPGPYRKRYDEAKAAVAVNHPEWLKCSKCNGAGANGKVCASCKGTGKVMLHAHKHAMLLMTKRLIRELWIVWTNGGEECLETPEDDAAVVHA